MMIKPTNAQIMRSAGPMFLDQKLRLADSLTVIGKGEPSGKRGAIGHSAAVEASANITRLPSLLYVNSRFVSFSVTARIREAGPERSRATIGDGPRGAGENK